jgi:dCTP deaminase
MILCDWQIRAQCEGGLVEPYDPRLVGPASLDVRLGSQLLVETPQEVELQRFCIADRCKEHPYLLKPGEFVLAETVEVFNLPVGLSAQFILKSSRGREGISHALAGFCDPGWSGSRLTMELHSLRRSHPIPLWPGMLIGQMVFMQMGGVPLVSYAECGRYNNDLTVMGSKG